MNTATKTGIGAAKEQLKKLQQSKEKEDKTNKSQKIYIPSEKRQQIIDDLRLV